MAVSQTLSVTEVAGSPSVANNTSKVRILWKSTQTGESHNLNTRTAKYYVSINDGAEKEYTLSYTLPLETTQTILDTTITVTHKDDGSGTVKVRTWMDTRISAGVVEKSQTVTLTTIARASEITSAGAVTLGKKCSVKWTPKSAAFRYKLKFSLGSWSLTTGTIHPNTTSAYTYEGTEIPIVVANQIPNAKNGTMSVSLYTYSDSAATKQVGSASTETFTVTVPKPSTAPDVSMTLTPQSSLGSAFNGLYIQGKTKVKATLSGTGKYSATIKTYGMMVEGKIYYAADNYTSEYLSQYGNITVDGYASDSRGYSGSVSKSIEVISYSRPKISDVVAARCDSKGNLSDSGTYLKIEAKRSYSQVKANGVQKNFCKIQYRYKAEGGTYSDWNTILAKDNLSSDKIKTGALLGVVLSAQATYVVQVQAIDDIGESASTTITIPTDKVYWHRDGARRSLTFGGYVEDDNTFAIADDITLKTKGPIEALGGGNIDTLGLGKKITATVDLPILLNNIRTPGNYYSPNAENSQYIAGSPYTAGGFAMTVREMQTTGYIRQELFYGRTTWIRHWNGTEWSDWWRYQTTTMPETASVDYVIETGTSGGWTYRKWKSGWYQLFGTFNVKPSESAINGTLYRTNNMTVAVPFNIKSAYVTGTAVGFYWITNGGISGDSAITLRLMSDKTFSTTNTIEVRLVVEGIYE